MGSPGLISSNEAANSYNFAQRPSATERGFWVRGGSTVEFQAPTVLIHETGHSLKWPHSCFGGDAGLY